MRRDEVELLEAVVRSANPVPHTTDVMDSDEGAAVALLVEHRRPTMTGSPIPAIPQPAGRPLRRSRRSMAWAFVAGFGLVVLVVGAAALILRTDDRPVAGRPAPPEMAEATSAVSAVGRELVTVVPGWQRIGDSWLETEPGAMEPLPNGGFVAAALIEHPAGSRLMWSPDGLNWLDGDPQRLLPPRGLEMAVVGEQVIILAGEDEAPTDLWIGNPKTGSWEPMTDLDMSGLEGQLVPGTIGISAGTDKALVTAVTAAEFPPGGDDPVEIGVAVWFLDPELRPATRTDLPVDTPATISRPTVWFDGRWHIMMPLTLVDYYWVETAIWSSADGATWTEDQLPAGWRMPMLSALISTTGPSGIVACANIDGNDDPVDAWFSPNGVDWNLLGPVTCCRGLYSDSLGFVLEGAGDEAGNGFALLSPDGTKLDTLDSPFPADTVAASGNNLIVHAFRGSEYRAEESAGREGLWLYHRPDEE